MGEVSFQHPGHVLFDEEREGPLRRALGVSLALHAIFFGLFLSASREVTNRGFRDLAPRPVEVALVEAPPGPPVAARPLPAEKERVPAPPPAEAAATQPAAADALYLKRLANREELARLAREREARARQEQVQRTSERERLRRLLADLKEKELEPATTAPAAEKSPAPDKLARAARQRQALASAERLAASREAAYRARVIAQVEPHWRVPANLARNRDLAAVVRFEVDPDGVVRSARLEESSGLRAFDDAVLRAVGELSRLDPPPRDFPHSFLVRFNNKEMGK